MGVETDVCKTTRGSNVLGATPWYGRGVLPTSETAKPATPTVGLAMKSSAMRGNAQIHKLYGRKKRNSWNYMEDAITTTRNTPTNLKQISLRFVGVFFLGSVTRYSETAGF